MWSFLPLVENKNVGAGLCSARAALPRATFPGGVEPRPYGHFERSASDAIHHIYYILFILYYLLGGYYAEKNTTDRPS